MDHTPFIAGAYTVALVVLGGLALASWLRMRRAEREGD
jgi:heme exporter protein CcmD